MSQRQLEVSLRRTDTSVPWGFRMEGGVDTGSQLRIVKVVNGSVAERVGLFAGDLVVSMNGSPAQRLSHEAAKMEIIRSANEIDMGVIRGNVYHVSSHAVPTQVKVVSSARIMPHGNSGGRQSAIYRSPPSPKPAMRVGPATYVIAAYQDQQHQPRQHHQPQIVQHHQPQQHHQPRQHHQPQIVQHHQPRQHCQPQQQQPQPQPQQQYYQPQQQQHQPPSFNAHPVPFGAPASPPAKPYKPYQPPAQAVVPNPVLTHNPATGNVKKVHHNPYNSPMGLYSQHNIDNSLSSAIKEATSPTSPGGGGGTTMNKTMYCIACGEMIKGVFVRVHNEHPMHSSCLKCCKCGVGLQNVGYFFINNALYCDTHAKQVSRPDGGNLQPVVSYK